MTTIFCEHCGEIQTNTPQMRTSNGVEWCCWCMCVMGEITEQQLERIVKEAECQD